MAAFEFVLVGPVFILLMFGIIAMGYMMWSWITLQDVAVQTARCAAINTDTVNTGSCPVPAACAGNMACYAVNVSKSLGFGGLTATQVNVNTSATCGSQANFTSVTITVPMSLFIPGGKYGLTASPSLTASSCYPNQSYTLSPGT